MSTSPLSKSLQLAIRKAVESSTHLLGHLVDSSDNFVEASDLTLELAYHTGELALRQCFVEHLQGRLLPGQPRGYYKTLELHILGDQTLALLVKRSDLNMSDLSDRVAAETMYIIFGSLFNRIGRRPLQDTFDCLFQPIIASANAAYVAYNENLGVQSRERPAETCLGRVRKIIRDASATWEENRDAFMECAREFPSAFVTGFRSAISTPDTGATHGPTPTFENVAKDPARQGLKVAPAPKAGFNRSAGPVRTQPITHRRLTAKPYFLPSQGTHWTDALEKGVFRSTTALSLTYCGYVLTWGYRLVQLPSGRQVDAASEIGLETLGSVMHMSALGMVL
ncbi:hypothetical protein K438DRAFT_1780421 [Mycena galopus ATCC 62051]|nr:hypothetical protein K438DRAFT_1780421 [Mycena galopus ATCC 62051]